ncbi:MAG: hypothetical protein ABIR98_01805 [Usitatibacter sp.]
MNTRMLLALAIAGVLSAGCAQWLRGEGKVAMPDPRIKCEASHTVCHITVSVINCKVTVVPDEKHVAYRPGGVAMLWTIRDSPGVTFASRDGIDFKLRSNPDARTVFKAEERPLASSTFPMHNSTTLGKYPYTVNVVDHGKVCAPHDPGVINEM